MGIPNFKLCTSSILLTVLSSECYVPHVQFCHPNSYTQSKIDGKPGGGSTVQAAAHWRPLAASRQTSIFSHKMISNCLLMLKLLINLPFKNPKCVVKISLNKYLTSWKLWLQKFADVCIYLLLKPQQTHGLRAYRLWHEFILFDWEQGCDTYQPNGDLHLHLQMYLLLKLITDKGALAVDQAHHQH